MCVSSLILACRRSLLSSLLYLILRTALFALSVLHPPFDQIEYYWLIWK